MLAGEPSLDATSCAIDAGTSMVMLDNASSHAPEGDIFDTESNQRYKDGRLRFARMVTQDETELVLYVVPITSATTPYESHTVSELDHKPIKVIALSCDLLPLDVDTRRA